MILVHTAQPINLYFSLHFYPVPSHAWSVTWKMWTCRYLEILKGWEQFGYFNFFLSLFFFRVGTVKKSTLYLCVRNTNTDVTASDPPNYRRDTTPSPYRYNTPISYEQGVSWALWNSVKMPSPLPSTHTFHASVRNLAEPIVMNFKASYSIMTQFASARLIYFLCQCCDTLSAQLDRIEM